MAGIQIKYSKEIARELGKIAVYLPGTQIDVGDIIRFPYSLRRISGKVLPLGSFRRITSLEKLGIDFEKPDFSNTPDTYRFSSKNAVNITMGTAVAADAGNDNLPGAKGKISVQFSSEGAIYFLGVECDSKTLNDLAALENRINAKGRKMLWDDTFLVISVTIARKALIAQSGSRSSELIIEGDVKGIQSGAVDISAGTHLKIGQHSSDMFIKDWSDDVTVFMDVVRFEEKVFGMEKRRGKGVKTRENSRIVLRKVHVNELFEDRYRNY